MFNRELDYTHILYDVDTTGRKSLSYSARDNATIYILHIIL